MKRKNFPDRKTKRREEAAERQKVYDALPDKEKAKRNPKKPTKEHQA